MDEMKDPSPWIYRYPGPAEDALLQKALDSERPPVRVVLLALDQGKFDSQRSLDELAALAEANGMQAVATVCQKRSTPEAATLLGEGKVEEARLVCLNTDAEAAIFDGELTGSQIRNLSAALQVEVLDRTMLILEIFRARATTNEGKLQTELATLKYRMPRLGLLQWEAHPVHEHLLEILLRAHLVNFEAITRRHGGAERDVLLHKLRAHGRCYGCRGVQFFERRRFAVFLYAEIHKQHDVIQRRVACLPQNERIGLAGKLPMNGSDVIARHILAQIEHLAWVVALAVLHFAFGLRRTGEACESNSCTFMRRG